MAKVRNAIEYCQKFEPREYGGRTFQTTDDRRTGDSIERTWTWVHVP